MNAAIGKLLTQFDANGRAKSPIVAGVLYVPVML